MGAYRHAVTSAVLGLILTMSFAVSGASFQVGITIVKGCDARTMRYTNQNAEAALRADCSANTPYNVSVGDRPMQDGRSPAPIVPDDTQLVSLDQRFRIATMTF